MKIVKNIMLIPVFALAGCGSADEEATAITTTSSSLTYVVVDTNQALCYDDTVAIDCPSESEDFYGQDAQYIGTAPSYTDNDDSTITDNNTDLVWAQDQSSETMSWDQASSYCSSITTGGHEWRMPSVKELWSIRDFSNGWPWIDTDYFNLSSDGSTLSQHHSWTSEAYLVESDYQNDQVIGDPYWIVNDWTGHIKAMSGNRYVRCVTGDEYGINEFVDNGDGTVSDIATGLMWSQDDNGETLYWEDALAYAEAAETAGYDDWRLPSIKELQSIADYSVTDLPAMDTDYFNLTETVNIIYDSETHEQIDTQTNYPFYWSSTSNPIESYEGFVDTDVDSDMIGTYYAWFLASGYNTDSNGNDLHGAGSVVFGAKAEENETEEGVYLMVRLVRDID